MALVPYDSNKKQLIKREGAGPVVPVPQPSGAQVIPSGHSESVSLSDIAKGVANLAKKAYNTITGGKRKRITAPPKPSSGALVVYRKPRYSTKRLRLYGNKYTGATKVNLEQFNTFYGGGNPDPILF